MKITKEQIKELKPCADGYEWYLEHGTEDLLETLLKVDGVNPGWARWLFTRLMTVRQRREIAIFSAEQVIHIFETKYPNDDRPRKAIEAAKAVYADDPGANRKAADAYAAAYDAYAYAAAYAAAYDADAAAAAYAAAAAVYAVYADAYDAAAAAYDAAAAAAAANARLEMQERIIREAVRILDGGES